jgi:hypothetical protein
MGSNCSFGHLKQKLWPKEGSGVKLAVWLPTTKSRESTSSQSEVCTQSYGAPKSWESQPWRFRDSHLGVLGQKNHLDVGLVERCKVYYKGEGGGFPQVRAVVSLVCPCCMWFVLAPKVLQLCTNHLVLVLCRSTWVNEACQLFLVPSRSSSTPLYPKVLRARECAPIPYSSIVFCLGSTFESLKESGVCHKDTYKTSK